MSAFLLLFGKRTVRATVHFVGSGGAVTPSVSSGVGLLSFTGTVAITGGASRIRASGLYGLVFSGTGSPVTTTEGGGVGEVFIPSTMYTHADWTNRLATELPSGWFPSEALTAGGVAYALLYGLATNYPIHNQQINFQSGQTRIKTATGSSLDTVSSDFLGSTLPRLLGESDDSYRKRILAAIVAPKSTIAAIQSAIDAYMAATSPAYIFAVVFDLMINPDTCRVLGVSAPYFVVSLTYVLGSSTAWFMDSDPTGYLGDSTYLTSIGLAPGVPDEGLDAVIREVKAEGTEPLYAVLNGV